jgi:hypothetical protein
MRWTATGPGMGLDEPNGCSSVFTRHRKVKVNGLEPAHDPSFRVAAELTGKLPFAIDLNCPHCNYSYDSSRRQNLLCDGSFFAVKSASHHALTSAIRGACCAGQRRVLS